MRNLFLVIFGFSIGMLVREITQPTLEPATIQIHDYVFYLANKKCLKNSGMHFIAKKETDPRHRPEKQPVYDELYRIACQDGAVFYFKNTQIYPGLYSDNNISEDEYFNLIFDLKKDK